MTLEERIELHDQWLRSMESNQSQFAAGLAASERRMEAFEEQVTGKINQITEILAQVVQHMAALTARVDKLAETVDHYIRFRGDGQQAN